MGRGDLDQYPRSCAGRAADAAGWRVGGAANHPRRLDAGVPDTLRPEPRLWVSLVAEHARRDGARRLERGGVCDWRRRECDLGGAVAGDGCCGQVVGEGGAGAVCGAATSVVLSCGWKLNPYRLQHSPILLLSKIQQRLIILTLNTTSDSKKCRGKAISIGDRHWQNQSLDFIFIL